jgi:hypothetical protein
MSPQGSTLASYFADGNLHSYPYAQQRAALERFAVALCSRPSALKDDDCRDPIIAGAARHVIACPGMPGQKPLKPGF